MEKDLTKIWRKQVPKNSGRIRKATPIQQFIKSVQYAEYLLRLMRIVCARTFSTTHTEPACSLRSYNLPVVVTCWV
jgi:hypothetical protein